MTLLKTHTSTVCHTILTLLALCAANTVCAEELPLWELGLGIGGLHQPYYPGSKQSRSYPFPVPILIYRGEEFKSDEEGMRAEIIKDDRYKLDMSLDFNLAIDSDDIDIRAGMDDLDSMLQIGPSVEVTLAEGEHDQLLLKLPLRANFGVSTHGLDESGYTFAPNLSYFRNSNLLGKPWRAGVAAGVQFGSRDYQNVYYGVEEKFATNNRPAYQADSGYSGARFLLTLRSIDSQRLWVWFFRYENIDGARFEESPLVQAREGFTIGFIYSRFLYKSKRTVSRQ